MLDIKLIRDNSEEIKQKLSLRGGDSYKLIDEILESDKLRRDAETEQQSIQSERKSASKNIGKVIADGGNAEEAKAAVKALGDKIKQLDEVIAEQGGRQRELLLSIPNTPYSSCPTGTCEKENPELRIWGTKPNINNPLNHVELAEKHGLISFEDGARISGSGYVVYRGKGARLERALIQFLLDTQTIEHGYEEVNVPHVIKRECMEGTGQLPKFESDMYGVEDNSMFLAPTAEVPVTNLYRDTLLTEDQLPIRLTTHTPSI